jgi:hypothetical protein
LNPRRIAARCAAAIFTACLLAAPSHGQDALSLKRRITGEKLSFIVLGARPGEQVFLHFDGRAEAEATTPEDFQNFRFADGGGTAHFDYPMTEFAAVGGPLYVRAFAGSPDRAGLIRSQVVSLRDVTALFLLVEDPDQRARVLCYDPILRTLETRLAQVDRESALAIAGSVPFAARGLDLVRGDTESTGALHLGEQLVDLVASADQSLLLALTREEVAAGRSLLRLRLIEADASAREIANLEVGNLESARGGQLVSAWLVSDSNDTHRVAIAQRQGSIREVVLGTDPGRGLTITPLSPLVREREEMLDVRMLGDALVVVTRPAAGGRRATTSRMVVFDLNERVAPIEVALDAVANAFVLVERQGVPTAFVSLESGDVAVVPLEGGVERPAALKLPGLRRIALGPDGGIYGLQERPAGDAVAIRIDPTSLTSTLLAIPGLSGGAAHFGVFGDARRAWLYAVQQRDPAGPYELLCAELDPVEGSVVGVAPSVVLDGVVKRVAGR